MWKIDEMIMFDKTNLFIRVQSVTTPVMIPSFMLMGASTSAFGYHQTFQPRALETSNPSNDYTIWCAYSTFGARYTTCVCHNSVESVWNECDNKPK